MDIEKARQINANLSQDDYCKDCANLASCNVVLKDDGSILEVCGDRIELDGYDWTVKPIDYREPTEGD